MSDLRGNALVVLLDGRRAGVLEQGESGHLRFTYDPAWRERAEPTPLSLSLPVATASHEDAPVRAYLWGLLPDSEHVLERWAGQYHVSARNPFALLRQVGEDCAGAVQFVTPERTEALVAGEGGVTWLDDDEIAARLLVLRRDPSAWHAASGGRFSLAGAQAKIALHHDPAAERWGDPWGIVPTTHIVKPAVTGFDEHDLNEHLCLEAARMLGMVAAPSRVLSFSGERAIVVDRYDRLSIDGALRRVHQEDMCQALAVLPTAKYQSEGGPTPEDIVGLLRGAVRSAEAAADSITRFVDALAFNWVVAGTDAHAKNYSVLLSGSSVRLAPLYDIASALPYDDLYLPKLRMAMKIGGEDRLEFIRRRHWHRLAEDFGLDGDVVVSRVADLATRVPHALATVARAEPVRELGSDLPERLLDRVSRWAAQCHATVTGRNA